ncbi:MAG: hypothetical protein HY908_02640 [Myxococcales bacterium]|nr:hypothetical protein [Myxococcales bacterium]
MRLVRTPDEGVVEVTDSTEVDLEFGPRRGPPARVFEGVSLLGGAPSILDLPPRLMVDGTDFESTSVDAMAIGKVAGEPGDGPTLLVFVRHDEAQPIAIELDRLRGVEVSSYSPGWTAALVASVVGVPASGAVVAAVLVSTGVLRNWAARTD